MDNFSCFADKELNFYLDLKLLKKYSPVCLDYVEIDVSNNLERFF